mmetsp:Transcript_105235/g.303540  ORF Transcript_105235/g.303540 Transcript_105235/m.303540 type:complete len:250 (+) Transcript_105235:1036-1785(+)
MVTTRRKRKSMMAKYQHAGYHREMKMSRIGEHVRSVLVARTCRIGQTIAIVISVINGTAIVKAIIARFRIMRYRSLSQSMLGSTLKKETRPPSPSSSEMQPNAEASCLIITGNQTKQTTLVYFRMSTKIQSRFIRSSDMARPGFFTPMLGRLAIRTKQTACTRRQTNGNKQTRIILSPKSKRLDLKHSARMTTAMSRDTPLETKAKIRSNNLCERVEWRAVGRWGGGVVKRWGGAVWKRYTRSGETQEL